MGWLSGRLHVFARGSIHTHSGSVTNPNAVDVLALSNRTGTNSKPEPYIIPLRYLDLLRYL